MRAPSRPPSKSIRKFQNVDGVFVEVFSPDVKMPNPCATCGNLQTRNRMVGSIGAGLGSNFYCDTCWKKRVQKELARKGLLTEMQRRARMHVH